MNKNLLIIFLLNICAPAPTSTAANPLESGKKATSEEWSNEFLEHHKQLIDAWAKRFSEFNNTVESEKNAIIAEWSKQFNELYKTFTSKKKVLKEEYAKQLSEFHNNIRLEEKEILEEWSKPLCELNEILDTPNLPDHIKTSLNNVRRFANRKYRSEFVNVPEYHKSKMIRENEKKQLITYSKKLEQQVEKYSQERNAIMKILTEGIEEKKLSSSNELGNQEEKYSQERTAIMKILTEGIEEKK